ncbi:hypothetical protein V4P56_03125 [Bartonella sp. B35(2025)]
MTNKHYPAYKQHTVKDKSDREQRNFIGKSIFAIIFTLIILWFIFSFLGSLFEKSPKHNASNYNTTESSQTITTPKKDLNTTSPLPHTHKDTVPPLFYEQNPSGEGDKSSTDSGEKLPSVSEKEKSDTIFIPEANQ